MLTEIIEQTAKNWLSAMQICLAPQEVAHLLAEAESYTSSASRQKSSKSTAKVIVAVVFGVGAIVGFAGFVMYLYKKSSNNVNCAYSFNYNTELGFFLIFQNLVTPEIILPCRKGC